MSHWELIGDALESELESFDRFMTSKRIDGEETAPVAEEFENVGSMLERPVPDRFVQQHLLEEHLKRV
jgi:hypothetical protein